MATVGEALQAGEAELAAGSSSARLDAELLLSRALGVSRTQVLTRLRDECPRERLEAFRQMLRRRAGGEPVAYILGEREFFGRSFGVSPKVLIPRPESELIVEEAIRASEDKRSVSFVDLGTGSGCLAVTIALELAARGVEVQGVAVDISPDALEVARSNAVALGAAGQLSFIESSWLSQRAAFHAPYDLIVANPPYVDPAAELQRDLSFEPPVALFSSECGLHDTRAILKEAPEFLAPGGVLLIEVGSGKREQLRRCPEVLSLGNRIELLGDSSPHDRFTVLKVKAVA